MTFLIPPKTPGKLALYCLALYVLLSAAWTALSLPVETSKGTLSLLFAGVGIAYGQHHGPLRYGKAALTCLYFALTLVAARIVPLIMLLRAVPGAELPGALVVTGVALAGLLTVHLIFDTLILAFLSRLASKQAK